MATTTTETAGSQGGSGRAGRSNAVAHCVVYPAEIVAVVRCLDVGTHAVEEEGTVEL